MVQFNLLPDVKLQYVKARRTKYLMTSISILVGGVALAVMLISLFVVNVVQKKSLSDIDKDIKTYSQQLQDVEDLSKILTVQNQLRTLTGLHDQKPVTSRIFTYVSQVTPGGVSLSKLSIDYETSEISFGGASLDFETISLFTDTLKATKYSTTNDAEMTPYAFDDVVLSNFTKKTGSESTFTITLTFDPEIFNALNEVKLIVPASSTADSSNAFEAGN